MNWFKRIVVKWVREDWEKASQPMPDDCYPSTKMSRGNSIRSNDINTDPTLHFKIFDAVGGRIVEFSRYDRRNDNHQHQIYIIGKDEDFGEKIAKISTLEVLR